jgi:tetratricopeptide (TPR) repeat protein
LTEFLVWKCPECHKINDGTLHQCPLCGHIFGDEDIKKNISRLSNDKLIKIVNIDFADYRKETIDIARDELEKRKKEEAQKIALEKKREEERRELQRKREKERKELEEYEKLKAQKIKEIEERRQSLRSEESNITHYYQILELKPNATKEEIKQAYKDLLTVWNPDAFADEPGLQQKAKEKVKEIDEAYEKLILYLSKSSEQPSQSEKNTTQTPEEETKLSYTQSSPLSSPTATLTDEDYAAFVGKNADKYINKFKKFNTVGTDNFVATWHWPAFIVGFWWMLYRKLYFWALTAFVLSLIPWVNIATWIAFGATGNYIYYKDAKKKILELKQMRPAHDIQRGLSQIGGVNKWVITVAWVVGALAVIGILAAIVIPGYLGYQERARKSQAQTEIQKGNTFFDKGSYHEAIDAFSKAIELNPQSPNNYYHRGLSYESLGNHQQAVIDFINAARMGNKDAQNSLSSQGIVW